MNQEVQAQYDELDLMDIILTLKKHWKMVVILTMVMALISGFITLFCIQPQYESQVVFELVNLSELSNNKLREKINDPGYQLELIRSRQFLEEILDQANLGFDAASLNQLHESVQVQKASGDTFRLKVRWADPEVSCTLTESIFEGLERRIIEQIKEADDSKRTVFRKQLEQKRIDLAQAENQLAQYEKENGFTFFADQVLLRNSEKSNDRELADVLKDHRLLQLKRDELKQNYLLIADSLAELEMDKALTEIVSIQVIELPAVPTKEASPSLPKNVLVAGFLGLFAGVMLAFFVEYIKNYQKNNAIQSQRE